MPRLPLEFTGADPQVVQQPRDVVRPNIAPAPLINPSVAGLPGQAVAQGGSAILQAQETIQRAQEMESRRQKAQDILDAEEAKQNYRTELNAVFDTLRAEGDFRTLPKELEKQARDIEFRLGQNLLTPGAQQRFRTEAREYMNVLLPKAQDFRYQAQEAMSKTVLLRNIEELSRGLMEADDPATEAYYREQLQSLSEDWQTVHLLGPEAAASIVRTVKDAAAVGEVKQNIQENPDAELSRLRLMQKDGVDLIGDQPISNLINLAQSESDEAASRQFAREQRAKTRLEEMQDRNEVDLLNRIIDAANLDELNVLKHEVQTRAIDRSTAGVTDEGQRRLVSALDARERYLITPREFSDQAVERAYETLIHTDRGQRTKETIRHLQANIWADTRLANKDARRMSDDLNSEMSETHISKLPDYNTYESQVNTFFVTTNPFDPFDEDGQRAMAFGRRYFNERLRSMMVTHGPEKTNEALPQIADETTQQFSTRLIGAIKDRLNIRPSVPESIYEIQPDVNMLSLDDIEARYSRALLKIESLRARNDIGGTTAMSWVYQLNERRDWERKALKALGRNTEPLGSQQQIRQQIRERR